MRFALALCVVVGCALCGATMTGARRRRIRLLESLVKGIRLLRVNMIVMLEPVQHALKASGSGALEAVSAAMARNPGVSAAEAWKDVCQSKRRRGGEIDALSQEDVLALDKLFEQLGESGREQQDILLNATCEKLGQNLEAAKRQAAEADRLYISLGAMTGLMIALILI